jgi:hypothetical protein
MADILNIINVMNTQLHFIIKGEEFVKISRCEKFKITNSMLKYFEKYPLLKNLNSILKNFCKESTPTKLQVENKDSEFTKKSMNLHKLLFEQFENINKKTKLKIMEIYFVLHEIISKAELSLLKKQNLQSLFTIHYILSNYSHLEKMYSNYFQVFTHKPTSQNFFNEMKIWKIKLDEVCSYDYRKIAKIVNDLKMIPLLPRPK